jgi:hypothetical protein
MRSRLSIKLLALYGENLRRWENGHLPIDTTISHRIISAARKMAPVYSAEFIALKVQTNRLEDNLDFHSLNPTSKFQSLLKSRHVAS